MKITEHFSASEFSCKDGTPVPDELLPNLRRLCEALEVLRAELGGKPVTIMSGYRTPAYNRKVEGAARSRHCVGDGADVQVAGIAPDVVADVAARLMRHGRIGLGGIGRYETFTHLDLRGRRARWDYRLTGRRG